MGHNTTCCSTHFPVPIVVDLFRFCMLSHSSGTAKGCFWLLGPRLCVYRYGVELIYKQQPLLRGRGVSYCKNLLSPRFEHPEGMLLPFLLFIVFAYYHCNFLFFFLKKRRYYHCNFWSKWSYGFWLGESDESVDKTYFVFLPPELCLVHPLPGSLVRGAQRLPSIMRRVESMLLAIQIKHIISYPVPASKVHYFCLLIFFKLFIRRLIPLFIIFICYRSSKP